MSNELKEKAARKAKLIADVAKETGFGKPEVYSDANGKYNSHRKCNDAQLEVINAHGGAALLGVKQADNVIALGGQSHSYSEGMQEFAVRGVTINKEKGYDKVIAGEVQSMMMKRNMQNGGMGV